MIKTSFTDIALDFATGDVITDTVNNILMITGEDTYVQIVMLRILIPKGRYLLNPSLGSDLHTLKQFKKSSVTREMVYDIIYDALKTEINEGNIEIDDVTIDKTQSSDGIVVSLDFTIVGGEKKNVNFLLTT